MTTRKKYSKEFKFGCAKPGDGKSFRSNSKLSPEQEEIRKLKSQVKRLQMEKDILKKATLSYTGQRNTSVKLSAGQ